MAILGFRDAGISRLGRSERIGRYHLERVRPIEEVRNQMVYSLHDIGNNDLTSVDPQLIRCTFHGAYIGNLYPFSGIQYYCNKSQKEIELSNGDPNFTVILRTLSAVTGWTIVEIEERGNYVYEYLNDYQYDETQN